MQVIPDGHQWLQLLMVGAAAPCGPRPTRLQSRYMKGTRAKKVKKIWQIEALMPGRAAELHAHLGATPWFRVAGPGLDAAPALMRLSRDQIGEVICTGFTMGLDVDPPVRVTATALHLPLQEIISAIVREIRSDELDGAVRLPSSGGVGFYGDHAPRAAWGFLVDLSPHAVRVRPGVKGHTPDDLREFARVWKLAKKDHPKEPTATLARAMHLTPQAIRARRKKAEAAGFLKPAARPRRRSVTSGGGR